MAAKPLDATIAENILIDWRLGQLSQRKIAEKHSVSNGTVANLTKGVVRDVSGIVSAGIQYQQALHTQDERIVSAIEIAVSEASKRMEWLNKANMTVANLTMRKIAIDMEAVSYQDLNAASATLGRTKDNVFGKSPETAIQINNQVEKTQKIYELTDEELEIIIARGG